MTGRNSERGRGSGGVFSTQINTRLINNRASWKEEREVKKSRLERVKYVSNQGRFKCCKPAARCKHFSSCSESQQWCAGRFDSFFMLSFSSLQLQLLHVQIGLLALIDSSNTGYFCGSIYLTSCFGNSGDLNSIFWGLWTAQSLQPVS